MILITADRMFEKYPVATPLGRKIRDRTIKKPPRRTAELTAQKPGESPTLHAAA
jgi:hypothetical protein